MLASVSSAQSTLRPRRTIDRQVAGFAQEAAVTVMRFATASDPLAAARRAVLQIDSLLEDQRIRALSTILRGPIMPNGKWRPHANVG
jgi:hypothetical protein